MLARPLPRIAYHGTLRKGALSQIRPLPESTVVPRPLGRGTVLFVDDEPDIRDVVARLLTRGPEPLDVLVAGDAPSALEMLRKNVVDLVVSDFRLPGGDGIRLLAEMRRLRPNTPRVLLTAYPSEDVIERAVNEAGVAYFLRKPFGAEDLGRVARALVAGHEP